MHDGLQDLHVAARSRTNAKGGRVGREEENVPEILLAEDNAADIYLIREALREHLVDCPLRVVTDGQQVLRILAAAESQAEPQYPALIILDLNLPRHDGIEILQRLKETPALRHVPVVVLTSSDSPRDRQAADLLGVTRFLRKPSSLEQFLSLGAVFKELLQPDSRARHCESGA